MVHEITQTFSSISQRIIEIQNELSKCPSMTNLAAYIGNIQALEQTKLEQVNFVSWPQRNVNALVMSALYFCIA